MGYFFLRWQYVGPQAVPAHRLRVSYAFNLYLSHDGEICYEYSYMTAELLFYYNGSSKPLPYGVWWNLK